MQLLIFLLVGDHKPETVGSLNEAECPSGYPLPAKGDIYCLLDFPPRFPSDVDHAKVVSFANANINTEHRTFVVAFVVVFFFFYCLLWFWLFQLHLRCFFFFVVISTHLEGGKTIIIRPSIIKAGCPLKFLFPSEIL